MSYDPEKHHRRSIRLKGWNYAGGGCYFVTICAHCSAGKVFESKLAKEIVMRCWHEIPSHYPEACINEFVVMPDHVHGIISVRARHASSVHSLRNILGSFKSAVSHELHRRGEACLARTQRKIWHRNYYEEIVRSEEAFESIARYIRLNPWKCIRDFGGGLRGIGNPTLWQAEKLGVLCSRNAPKIGYIPDADVYFGGWHSPKEKEIFDWLLQKKRNVIICPAWSISSVLNEKNQDKFAAIIDGLKENRILILEIPNRGGDIAEAEERNRFVVQHADRLFTPHVTKGGMLDKILREKR